MSDGVSVAVGADVGVKDGVAVGMRDAVTVGVGVAVTVGVIADGVEVAVSVANVDDDPACPPDGGKEVSGTLGDVGVLVGVGITVTVTVVVIADGGSPIHLHGGSTTNFSFPLAACSHHA